MKLLLLTIAASMAFFTQAKTQCLTHVKYTAAKMEILDADMNVTDTKEEPLTFETRAGYFTGIREEEITDSIHGQISNVTCNWKEPFKNGKITIECNITGKDNDMGDATVTIEAVEGKINILISAKARPGQIIRVVVDKYEEIK